MDPQPRVIVAPAQGARVAASGEGRGEASDASRPETLRARACARSIARAFAGHTAPRAGIASVIDPAAETVTSGPPRRSCRTAPSRA